MRQQDQQDLRTPMAWQRRDTNYQQQHHIYSERFGMVPEVGQMPGYLHYPTESGGREDVARGRRRPRSPGTDTSTSTSTDDSQLKYGGALMSQGGGPPHAMGTLRSVQSTVTTWDGEPCPVHHVTVALQPTHLRHYLTPPPPAVLLPPMLRPRPLVLPADAPAPPEPLPVRDPASPLPPKDGTLSRQSRSFRCCRGHIIVLWTILCVVSTGILLGVVLRFVFA